MDLARLDDVLMGAVALSREGRAVDSERLLRSALEEFPQSTEVRLQIAAKCLGDRPEEAEAFVAAAVALAPDDPFVLVRAGSMLIVLDKIELARVYAKRAVAAAPSDFAFFPDLAHLVGRLAWLKGSYALAEESLRAAFDDEPGAIGHARVLANYLLSQGRTTEAHDVVARGLEHRPGDDDLRELRDRLLDDSP
jgi:hypothetical protein